MSDSTRIRKIAAATDFSETAEIGVTWALALAKIHEAEVALVHGLLLPNSATDFIPSPADLTAELQEAARQKLDEATVEIRGQGVTVSSHLRLGLPSQVILELAEEQEADLVVIGTRGLSGLKHLLLGSTTERVVQHATCPVLSVHPGDTVPADPVQTILVPTDFSKDSERAVEAARTVLPSGGANAELVLLHAYHLPFEYTAYGTVPTSLSSFSDVVSAAQAQLEERAGKLRDSGLNVRTRAVEGYPPDAIVAEAKTMGAQLIAMGTHGRTGLSHLLMGSTAQRVVQHAGCPVLTVPRKSG